VDIAKAYLEIVRGSRDKRQKAASCGWGLCV